MIKILISIIGLLLICNNIYAVQLSTIITLKFGTNQGEIGFRYRDMEDDPLSPSGKYYISRDKIYYTDAINARIQIFQRNNGKLLEIIPFNLHPRDRAWYWETFVDDNENIMISAKPKTMVYIRKEKKWKDINPSESNLFFVFTYKNYTILNLERYIKIFDENYNEVNRFDVNFDELEQHTIKHTKVFSTNEVMIIGNHAIYSKELKFVLCYAFEGQKIILKRFYRDMLDLDKKDTIPQLYKMPDSLNEMPDYRLRDKLFSKEKKYIKYISFVGYDSEYNSYWSAGITKDTVWETMLFVYDNLGQLKKNVIIPAIPGDLHRFGGFVLNRNGELFRAGYSKKEGIKIFKYIF